MIHILTPAPVDRRPSAAKGSPLIFIPSPRLRSWALEWLFTCNSMESTLLMTYFNPAQIQSNVPPCWDFFIFATAVAEIWPLETNTNTHIQRNKYSSTLSPNTIFSHAVLSSHQWWQLQNISENWQSDSIPLEIRFLEGGISFNIYFVPTIPKSWAPLWSCNEQATTWITSQLSKSIPTPLILI